MEEPQTSSLGYVPLMLCNRVGWENFHSINKNSVLGYPAACWQPNPTKLVVWSFGGQSTVPPLLSFLLSMQLQLLKLRNM